MGVTAQATACIRRHVRGYVHPVCPAQLLSGQASRRTKSTQPTMSVITPCSYLAARVMLFGMAKQAKPWKVQITEEERAARELQVRGAARPRHAQALFLLCTSNFFLGNKI